MTQSTGAVIIPLEADAMKNIEMAFMTRGFCVLPRGGWIQPVNLLTHYSGIVWRENVVGFGRGGRFIKAGGFKGKADWCGIVRISTLQKQKGPPQGRWLFFEAKKDEKSALSEMQSCMAKWMAAYGALVAKVWDYQSTVAALARFGL